MKRFVFLMMLSFSTNLFADPFYGEKPETQAVQAVENQPHFAKQATFLTACTLEPSLNQLNLAEEFQDLKLVGLIHIHGQYKALFKNKENKLISLAQNDFISAQGIQIKKINLKSLEYIHWGLTEHCEAPHIITLKL